MRHIENIMERPRSYYNIDGLGELGLAVLALGFSLLGWLQTHTPPDAVWHEMYMAMGWMFAVAAIIHFGTKAIKKRITYPRTGYVEYRRRDIWLPMALGVVTSLAVVAAIVAASRMRWNLTTPASLVGLLFAATYAYGIARMVRWKWVVVALMAAGSLVIAVLPADTLRAVGSPLWMGAYLLTFILYGMLLLASGGITFWLYLRRTQPPARETE